FLEGAQLSSVRRTFRSYNPRPTTAGPGGHCHHRPRDTTLMPLGRDPRTHQSGQRGSPMILGYDRDGHTPLAIRHRLLDLAPERRLYPVPAPERADYQNPRAPCDGTLADGAQLLRRPLAGSARAECETPRQHVRPTRKP